MHILDIAMNSIKANSTQISIAIEESNIKNTLMITIEDNGCGMDEEILRKVTDPFFTTRTTRKVGLGLPMLKESCERCNGYLKLDSKVKEGTKVECVFEKSNIDRPPLGNMGETIMTIINSIEGCELIYSHKTDLNSFVLNTIELKNILENVDIKEYSVLIWIKDYINESVEYL